MSYLPELHYKALQEGHEDETCSKCKAEFMAHHHFVRCRIDDCPMTDGKGTLLERWAKDLENEVQP